MAAKESDGPSAAATCTGLKIATGRAGIGYSKLFNDISKVCGATVPVCEVQTTGGLDNLNELSTKGADIGFAAIDTYDTMRKGDANIAALQQVMALNSNVMHTIVLSNGYQVTGPKKYGLLEGDKVKVTIRKFSDLAGKDVIAVGSAQLLIRQVDRSANMKMRFKDVNTEAEAIPLLKTGKYAAVITVAGWPNGFVRKLTAENGLTLVPFDTPSTNAMYVVKPINYKNIGIYNMNSLTVQNALYTRAFAGEKSKSVQNLKSCIIGKLNELKDGDFEPAWNEIK